MSGGEIAIVTMTAFPSSSRTKFGTTLQSTASSSSQTTEPVGGGRGSEDNEESAAAKFESGLWDGGVLLSMVAMVYLT